MPPPGDLPNSGIEPRSPTLQVYSILSEPPEKSLAYVYLSNCWFWREDGSQSLLLCHLGDTTLHLFLIMVCISLFRVLCCRFFFPQNHEIIYDGLACAQWTRWDWQGSNSWGNDGIQLMTICEKYFLGALWLPCPSTMGWLDSSGTWFICFFPSSFLCPHLLWEPDTSMPDTCASKDTKDHQGY